MNFGKLLYSLFNALIALFFILIGIGCLFLPWVPSIRTHIILFIMENTLSISLFGSIFLAIGASLLTTIVLSTRHRYYRLRSGRAAVSVDETLIQQYLDRYLERLFPKYEIPNRVLLKNNSIHILADFPYLPLEEQKPLLRRVENELASEFSRILGFRQDFYLSVSFRDREATHVR